jgi:DNA ligase (NAD+)
MSKKNPYMNTPFPKFKDSEKLSKQEAEDEVQKLREAIEHHNYLYYIKNKPKISDKKFDTLFHRLEQLEEQFKDLQSDVSPTRKIGAPPVDKLKKRKHASPMLSLNSSDEDEAIEGYMRYAKEQTGKRNLEFVLEPKLDGLSVEVVYKKGIFEYATTRGDGQTGEDISKNVKTIGSVPLKLRASSEFPDELSVRGEIFMKKEDFRNLNKQRIENGEEPFANARNAAAGIVRQLDSKKVADKPLDIFFYEIINNSDNGFDSHWNMLQKIPEWGLKHSEEIKKAKKFNDVRKYYKKMTGKRDSLSFEIDGIVIKLDDRELRRKIGTRQRSPRWAYAWKFPPKKELTTLQEIVIQVGRTGILTPVALFDPVEVGGVTVSRATLHNEDEAKKKDVRPGDKIRVLRAGDVIPEVAERVEKGKKRGRKKFSMPKKCPVCNTKVVREGAYVICPAGLSCKAQLKGRLVHYASREAMDIDTLGEKNSMQLIDKNLVKTIPDLYKLKPDDLGELEGFAKKSAMKLHDAIQNTKKPELYRFLYALGIRHVGGHMARVLAQKFRSLDNLKHISYKDLMEIHEIGPEIAESVAHFFQNNENIKMLNELENLGVKAKQVSAKQAEKLKDKTIVLTGELEDFTRNEAKARIESLGGRATSSVSENTDYVVVGDDPGSKLDEAKKRKVKTIDEQQFHKLLEKGKV